jgi:DNA-binding NtrC family response regulator
VFEQIEKLNLSPVKPVLILGPTGAGKSRLAKLIHFDSGRARDKFCREQAADNRATDFGIAKGRWVGYGKNSGINNISNQGIPGIIQQFAGGTVFLDEVVDLTWDMQGFLRDVLDREEIPLTAGTGDPVKPFVRLIFATNADLEKAVSEGRFRHDLLARMDGRTIWIPPLSARMEDVFSFVYAECGNHSPGHDFLLAMLQNDWPGNVRELRRVLSESTARIRSTEDALTLDHLRLNDPHIVSRVRSMKGEEVSRALLSKLAAILRQRGFEQGRRGSGLQREMARILRTSEPTLSRWTKDLGISGNRSDEDQE